MTLSGVTLERICRYPVKGFAGQNLDKAALAPGRGLPYDRHLAIVSGNRPETPAIGGWVPSRTFIQNTVFDDLLTFDCRFDPERDHLEFARRDGDRIRICLNVADDLKAANTVLARWFRGGPLGAVHLVRQSVEHGFWDYTDSMISIINLQSVESLARGAGQKLDPARFRGNLYIAGLPAWEEFSWTGKIVRVGETELQIIRPILRCAATSVDPESGVRDFNVPGLMQQKFGHAFCGVYARVISPGPIRIGDRLSDADTPPSEFGVQPDNAPERNRWPVFVSAQMLEIDGKASPFLSGDFAPDINIVETMKVRVHDLVVANRSWASFDARIAKSEGHSGLALTSETDEAVRAVAERIADGKKLLVTGPF